MHKLSNLRKIGQFLSANQMQEKRHVIEISQSAQSVAPAL